MSVKYKKILCAAALLAFLYPAGCKNEQTNTTPEEAPQKNGVVIESNTAMRIDPLVFAGCIMRLEKGDYVEIIGKSAEKSRIARTSDYWYYVKLDDGITGWIYGQNLKLIDIKNRSQLESILTELHSQDLPGFLKAISGKWWSTNSRGDFTNHGLEIYEDHTYKSYLKGKEDSPLEGEYTIDFVKNEIVFPNGTSFKKNLKFTRQGLYYSLTAEFESSVTRFQKIQETLETQEQPNVSQSGQASENEPNNNSAEASEN